MTRSRVALLGKLKKKKNDNNNSNNDNNNIINNNNNNNNNINNNNNRCDGNGDSDSDSDSDSDFNIDGDSANDSDGDIDDEMGNNTQRNYKRAVYKPIGGISMNDKNILKKKRVDVAGIESINYVLGFGTIEKPLWSKQIETMKRNEKILRNYLLNKEISAYTAQMVPYYDDLIDINFSKDAIHKFFTIFGNNNGFNFNKLLTAWKRSRAPTS